MSDAKTAEAVKWWQVNRWMREPKEVLVIRESRACIWIANDFFRKGIRRLKGSGFHRTEAEAWRQIATNADLQISALRRQLDQQNTIKNRALAAKAMQRVVGRVTA